MNWIFPTLDEKSNVSNDLENKNCVEWRQYANTEVRVGDIVYIYIGRPHKKIRYKTIVDKMNIQQNGLFMRLRLLNETNTIFLTLEELEKFGIKYQGLEKLKKVEDPYLQEYLNDCFTKYGIYNEIGGLIMYFPNEKERFIKDATEILIKESIGEFGNNMPIRNEDDFNEAISNLRRNTEKYRDNEEDKRLEIEEEWLGRYHPMSSPGIIELRRSNLISFFNDNIEQIIHCGYNFTFTDYKDLAEITIRKTFYHEYFHHYSDIQKQLFGFNYEKNIEEALAVAWSRLKVNEFINYRNKYKTISALYDTFLRKIYNYCIPGYCDWKLYILPEDFCRKVIEYMLPSSSNNLLRNGVNIGQMILTTLDIVYNTSDALVLRML